MKYEVQLEDLSGRISRIVELERNGGGWRVHLDGQPIDADAVGDAGFRDRKPARRRQYPHDPETDGGYARGKIHHGKLIRPAVNGKGQVRVNVG